MLGYMARAEEIQKLLSPSSVPVTPRTAAGGIDSVSGLVRAVCHVLGHGAAHDRASRSPWDLVVVVVVVAPMAEP